MGSENYIRNSAKKAQRELKEYTLFDNISVLHSSDEADISALKFCDSKDFLSKQSFEIIQENIIALKYFDDEYQKGKDTTRCRDC